MENEDSKVLDDDVVLYFFIFNELDDIETFKFNINDIRLVDI